MIAPILYGFAAASIVALVSAISSASSVAGLGLSPQVWPRIGWLALLAGLVALTQWWSVRRSVTPSEVEIEKYDGLPDLLIHLHSPALPDRSSRWAFRGLLSSILASLGFGVGPEGGASEMVQAMAMRSRSAALKWSDLVRRSDAAMALSAGISAAFGAPFAAVLVASELAIGGRVLSSVLAALSAYLCSDSLAKLLSSLGLSALDYRERLAGIWGFRLLDWREWLITGAVVLLVSVLASGGLVGLRQVRSLSEGLGRRRAHWMTLFAALLLGSIAFLAPHFLLPIPALFEQLMLGALGPGEKLGLVAFLFLTLVAVGAGMGSMGIWWPTFLLGAALSALLAGGLPEGWVPPGFAPNLAVLGAVAFGSVWLKTPISLAVLAFEFTQNGAILLPALLAATISRWVDLKLGQTAWLDQLLVAKGFPVVDGRSLAVLQSLKVRDAMVTNVETVDEREPVRSCHEKIRSCHYPFLPVIDARGAYKGLLTVDMIEQGLISQLGELGVEGHSHERLAGLLEAKDLLYRSGIEVPAVGSESSLAGLTGTLRGQSCLPVVDSDGRVVGLLFAHDVRQCYDREVARLSFVIQANQRRRLARRLEQS